MSQAKPLGYFNDKAEELKLKSPGRTEEASEMVILKLTKRELDKAYPARKQQKKGWV